MLAAKRLVEALVDGSRQYISLPVVGDERRLIEELDDAGVASAPAASYRPIDVRELRSRLKLTREEFALRYGFEVETLRNWESGRREPDKTARSYLRVIEQEPELVEEAYAPALKL